MTTVSSPVKGMGISPRASDGDGAATATFDWDPPDPTTSNVARWGTAPFVTIIEIIIALFLPWLTVLLRKGLCIEVLWAFLLQLLGHIPGVIYALWVIAKSQQSI